MGHSALIWRVFETLAETCDRPTPEALLQITRKTIYGYKKRGLIPYVLIESNVRFPKHPDLQWREERTIPPQIGEWEGRQGAVSSELIHGG